MIVLQAGYQGSKEDGGALAHYESPMLSIAGVSRGGACHAVRNRPRASLPRPTAAASGAGM